MTADNRTSVYPDGRTPQWRREMRRARIALDVAAFTAAAAGFWMVAVGWTAGGLLIVLAFVFLSAAHDAATRLTEPR